MHGRQVVVTQPLRTLAEEGVERIAKILGKITSAHVVLTAEKHRQIAEVTVKTGPVRWSGCASPRQHGNALREALVKTETRPRGTRTSSARRSESRSRKTGGRGGCRAQRTRGAAESKSAKAAMPMERPMGKAMPSRPSRHRAFLPKRAPIAEPMWFVPRTR